MKVIFDSNVWIAYFREEDSLSKKAKEILENHEGIIVIPEYIFLEVTTVLQIRTSKKTANLFMEMTLENDQVELLFSDEILFEETQKIFLTQEKKLSFTDCSLVSLSSEFEIITFDEALQKYIEEKNYNFLFSKNPMHKKIAVLPGDGIGPEVMVQAIKVLKKIEEKFGHTFELTEKLVGGAAIDATEVPLPEDTIKSCEEADSILFGSVGGPKWDTLPREKRPEVGALLPLRKHFDLFANLRPASVLPQLSSFSPLKPEIVGDGFDYIIVRELTGDVYFGEKKSGEDFGADEMKYTRPEVERIARVAFETAKKRKGKLLNVDKSNVLVTSQFWRKVVEEIHQNEFPEIELDHLYIDNTTMQVLVRPQEFDVIVTGNMFGDILSDESAQISGSIGMLASASMNAENFGLFEPMGGSAPDIAGQGVANPIAQIRCVSMMLGLGFGLKEEQKSIDDAILAVLEDGFRTGDIYTEGMKQVGTEEMGEAIVSKL